MSEIAPEATWTAPALLVVEIDVAPAYEEELNRWYDEEHIPERLAMPGFQAARRYRSLDQPSTFLAVYAINSPETVTSDSYMSRPQSPWTRRLMPHWRAMTRTVWTQSWPATPGSAPAAGAS